MIRNLETDKEKEFEILKKWIETIENVIEIDSYKEKFLFFKEEYLNDLKWNLDHIDERSRHLIKRLNLINNELINHVQGFTLLIKNQDDLKIKEDLIQSFLTNFKKNDLQLKEILI